MSKSAVRVAWPLGLVTTGLIIAHGIVNLAGGGSFDSASDRTIYGSVQVIAGVLIASGLWLSARSRWSSIALVAAGVVAIAVLMPWFISFTLPAGLGLAALAHSRRRVAA